MADKKGPCAAWPSGRDATQRDRDSPETLPRRLTGARHRDHRGAGLVGSMLRPRLARPDRTLRLLDIAPLEAGPGEEAVQASVTDLEAMTAACRGAAAIIHLAGIPGEACWPRILETNINGGYVAFEAARRAGAAGHLRLLQPRGRIRAPRGLPGARLRLPGAGHLLRGVQGGHRGAGRDVPPPLRPGRDLRSHPVLHPAAGRRADAVHLAVAGRRRPAVRGLPDHGTAGIPGHLRGLGQHPRRLGLAGRGQGPGLPAAGRRGRLRRRDPGPGPGRRPGRRSRCCATWAARSPCPTTRSRRPSARGR